jgi:hypothetical protein
MKKNFKTTLFGITAILGGVTTIIKGDLTGGVTAIFTGFGLLFAKDY